MIPTTLFMFLGVLHVFMALFLLSSIITIPTLLILYFNKRRKGYLIAFQVVVVMAILILVYFVVFILNSGPLLMIGA